MKNKSAYILLLLTAAVINFYCTTAENFLSTKSIPVGGEADFTFKTDSSGGYSWKLKENSDETVLKFLSKDYISGLNGQGSEVFRFKGLKKGTVELIFTYTNKNTGSTIHKTQIYSVTVR